MEWTTLSGGISSDIWRVDLPGRSLCIKRALPNLKVSVDWPASISRNSYEWKWLRFAASLKPGAVPSPLAHDATRGLLAMNYLPPEQFPVWKTQLLAGTVTPGVAAQVGALLAELHDASANQLDLAREFDTHDNFRALRIEPYLLATSVRHPDLADVLYGLAHRLSSTTLALVHGDVSPKNILIGPQGPIFLDAECAWYGDPAFDLAFCLNHLLLKSLVRPDSALALFHCFSLLAESYLERIHFEARTLTEARAAELLPALMLARVDGNSPVEYLVDKFPEQVCLRRFARNFLKSPVLRLAEIATAWAQATESPRAHWSAAR
jgi:aminoglycoside phosphotransferase (APT) family kinase protein